MGKKRVSHLLCLTMLAVAVVGAIAGEDQPKEKEKKPGEVKEKEKEKEEDIKVEMFEIKTPKMVAKFTNWGATLVSFSIPDKDGKMYDVVLGYDTPDSYKDDTVYFGATVGRVANRIGGAQFKLDGKEYKLVANEGKNMLHGGAHGFSDVVWKMEKLDDKSKKPTISFTYKSPDGEEGFPGAFKAKVLYTLNPEKHTMSIHMTGKVENKSSSATPVNMANHAYWNLGGHESGDILSHKIQIAGSKITPTNDELIPTGELKEVKGTPYDFLEAREIGSNIKQLLPKGYDINYALDRTKAAQDANNHNKDKDNKDDGTELHLAAILEDPKTGIKMEVLTNQPGLQFYTGDQLTEVKGKNGAVYKKNAGLCLETQGFPDAVNHPDFPSQIVKPGEQYKHVVRYKFTIPGTDKENKDKKQN